MYNMIVCSQLHWSEGWHGHLINILSGERIELITISAPETPKHSASPQAQSVFIACIHSEVFFQIADGIPIKVTVGTQIWIYLLSVPPESDRGMQYLFGQGWLSSFQLKHCNSVLQFWTTGKLKKNCWEVSCCWSFAQLDINGVWLEPEMKKEYKGVLRWPYTGPSSRFSSALRKREPNVFIFRCGYIDHIVQWDHWLQSL